MADPLTDKINVQYHKGIALFNEDLTQDRLTASGVRIHKSRDGALGSLAQEVRSLGAPEDARVIIDYLPDWMVDRITIDWHTPREAGQPRLVRGFESFRLSEIPR